MEEDIKSFVLAKNKGHIGGECNGTPLEYEPTNA